jgi:hypothetical protein
LAARAISQQSNFPNEAVGAQRLKQWSDSWSYRARASVSQNLDAQIDSSSNSPEKSG